MSESFTLKYDRIADIVACKIRVLQFDPNMPSAGSIPAAAREYIGVWDTGASKSLISERVVSQLDLRSSGFTVCETANGPINTETYYVTMFLPNHVAFGPLLVARGDLPIQFDILIGMDIMGTGDVALTNFNRKTVFSFRHPSMCCIDFVEEELKSGHPLKSNRKITQGLRYPEAPKNAPCPCDSGKKHKKCCWDKPPEKY